jgi:hypothetical protein
MQTSHSAYIGQAMNATTAKLLRAAAEFLRVEKQLAVPLRLRAVDVRLALRQSLTPLAAIRMSGLAGIAP